MKLHYFGTKLDCAGHYTFILNGTDRPYMDSLPYGEWAFDMEKFPVQNMKKGDSHFFIENGKSILFFCGSPYDKRLGCKSVFWVDSPDMDERTMRLMLVHDAFYREVIKRLIY